MSKDKNNTISVKPLLKLSVMKAINFLATALFATALLSSCSSRVYERAAAYTLADDDTYGFAQASVEGSFDKITAPASMTVTLTRHNAAEEAVVPVSAPKSLGLPSTVTFEAGSTTASLHIDMNNIPAGTTLTDVISFAPGVRTEKGRGSAKLNIRMDYTWAQMSSSDRSYSLLTDDVVAPGIKGRAATFPVIIEEAIEAPGMFRLVNAMRAYSNDSNPETAYLVIDATNPDRVTIARQNTCVEGMAIESLASRFLAEGHRAVIVEDAQYFGRVENGEIIFPRSESICVWTGDKATNANLSGSFRIVLPEKVAEVERTISHEDYNLGVEYYARVNNAPDFNLDPASIPTDSYAYGK